MPPQPPRLDVSLARRHPRLRCPARDIRRLFDTLAANAGSLLPPGAALPHFLSGACPAELSVVLLTDTRIAALHAAFLGDPTPTDVITFPGDAALGSAGEICVSADTARAYAQNHGGDWRRELALYLAHGFLHLLGHDDHTPPQRRRMRAAEHRALALLDAANAIPRFAWKADPRA